jgi:hypothetical protein
MHFGRSRCRRPRPHAPSPAKGPSPPGTCARRRRGCAAVRRPCVAAPAIAAPRQRRAGRRHARSCSLRAWWVCRSGRTRAAWRAAAGAAAGRRRTAGHGARRRQALRTRRGGGHVELHDRGHSGCSQGMPGCAAARGVRARRRLRSSTVRRTCSARWPRCAATAGDAAAMRDAASVRNSNRAVSGSALAAFLVGPRRPDDLTPAFGPIPRL